MDEPKYNIDPPSISNNTLEEGYYKTKLVKGSAYVPVFVWYCDGNPNKAGELTQDECWKCTIDGVEKDPFDLDDSWLFFEPITLEEFKFMAEDAEHAKLYREDDPKANPLRPVAGIGHNDAPSDVLLDLANLASEIGDFEVGNGAGLKTLESAQAAVMFAKRLKVIHKRLDEEFKLASKDIADAMANLATPYKKAQAMAEELRVDFLLDLHKYMETKDVTEVVTDYGPKAYFQSRSKLEITDEKAIHKNYKSPDNAKITKALKADKVVKGAELVAVKSVIVS